MKGSEFYCNINLELNYDQGKNTIIVDAINFSIWKCALNIKGIMGVGTH